MEDFTYHHSLSPINAPKEYVEGALEASLMRVLSSKIRLIYDLMMKSSTNRFSSRTAVAGNRGEREKP